jgi:hypothetical protein
MATAVHSKTFEGSSLTERNYHEFDPEFDGPTLAAAMLEKYGTRQACIEEMLYLTIIAASRDDRTTINGMECLRRYWRSHPE